MKTKLKSENPNKEKGIANTDITPELEKIGIRTNEGVDILPSLKRTGFLDTSVRDPGFTTVGITRTLQFGEKEELWIKS